MPKGKDRVPATKAPSLISRFFSFLGDLLRRFTNAVGKLLNSGVGSDESKSEKANSERELSRTGVAADHRGTSVQALDKAKLSSDIYYLLPSSFLSPDDQGFLNESQEELQSNLPKKEIERIRARVDEIMERIKSPHETSVQALDKAKLSSDVSHLLASMFLPPNDRESLNGIKAELQSDVSKEKIESIRLQVNEIMGRIKSEQDRLYTVKPIQPSKPIEPESEAPGSDSNKPETTNPNEERPKKD